MALREATVAVAAAADPASVFESVGCRFEDAASLAREGYRLRLCVAGPGAENSVDWSEPLLSVSLRQSERAWLNGCLTGLFMAGPLAETMPSTALRSAERTLRAQALHAEQLTGELDSMERTLVRAEFDPKAFLEVGLWAAHGMYKEWGAFPGAGDFSRRLPRIALDMALCARTLAAIWMIGILVATQARREHAWQ